MSLIKTLAPEQVRDWFDGVHFDSDGGSFALVGASLMISIDVVHHADHDGDLYVVNRCRFKGGEVFSHSDMSRASYDVVEMRVYDDRNEALRDYLSTISEGTELYLDRAG